MQNRYKISNPINVKKESTRSDVTIQRLETYIVPQIEFSDFDTYIYSKVGDRLDNLAFRFYQDQSLWWVIAKANNIGKGSWNIEPGVLLRIPSIVNGYDILEELQIYQKEYR